MRDYQTKANEGGIPDSITAEKLGAGEANSILTENKTAVSSSDQVLAVAAGTSEETDQLAKALAVYGGGGAEYCIDTGAVNAYVLNPVSPKKAIPAYFDGMTLSFKPGNASTGASTVNYAAIGVKNITDLNGNALSGGEISGDVRVRYNLASDRVELVSLVGRSSSLVIFTSSGSYSKPDGLKFIEVTIVGGGGGGGGMDGQGGGTFAAGKPGGGGGASIKMILASALSASETVTIGAGGTGGAAGVFSGSAGGTTSLGSHCSATGGSGGPGKLGDSLLEAYEGVAGGLGSGGDIDIDGGPGGVSVEVSSGSRGAASGNGGGSIFSGGAKSENDQDGDDALGYGGGGSGGSGTNLSTNYAGGEGSDGIIIIKEFF